MFTKDFDFDLPEKFIAQSPALPRDSAKLFVYDTKNDQIIHEKFSNIVNYLNKSDTLVVNKSKVFPARILFPFKARMIEVFILKRILESEFLVMVRPGKVFKIGLLFDVNEILSFTVIKINEDGTRIIKFNLKGECLVTELEKIGKIPLPPYIKNAEEYSNEYQTVFSDENFKSSVAAPTAGLHFTNELLDRIRSKGVSYLEVVLSVGRGTFMPVSTEKLEDHNMHFEEFYLDKKTADSLNQSLVNHSRIIAVGTTSVRVLESAFKENFNEMDSSTNLFIYPGHYNWKVVDSLITNFHLPKSSLLMLVSSFLEHKGVNDPVKKLLELYEIAKLNNYRFYSFGDAMFIY